MNKEVHPLSLLVVEDNPGDYVLLERSLHKMNLPLQKIVKAESLEEAGTKIRKGEKFDLVFLDLSLPDSGGIETFITLNQWLKEIPIVILSGLADTIIAIEAISLGAQDYLIKGEFDDKLLSKSIQYSIERKGNEEKLRLSNQQYEMVNKATNDTIWEWNYETNSGLWGEGLVKNFGYSREHLLKNDNWTNQYLHPDDVEPVRRKIQYHLDNRLENWQEEFRFRCADGSYKHIFDRGFILYEQDGRPYRMYGAMTDVTEKRILEKELREQQIRQQKLITEIAIQAQEKERSEIAKELHDNVNQILATVRMFLNMAREGNDFRRELLDRSFENVNLAISEIRKLSKSLVTPSLEDVGLKEAIEELSEEITWVSNIQIILSFEGNNVNFIPPQVKLMIYRIIQEQINNILKYAQAKSVFITFKTDSDFIYLTIEDNGVGFDSSKKAKGIGLKNIRSRVEFYSGTLNIITSPGKGCILQIKIPSKHFEL